MPVLPPALLQSLKSLPDFDMDGFIDVHLAHRPPVSIRFNPQKMTGGPGVFEGAEPIPWAGAGYYLPQRPAFAQDPLWHAGAYYVQEASSMILEAVWQQYLAGDGPSRVVLDLCAAPGGKSTHLLSLLRPQDMLISNEVIANRVTVLLENITRWGHANVVVTQNDPSAFGRMPHVADVMVVDAPCSGSGLFRRDPEAMQEWSAEAVQHCSLRQQRILADAWDALKPGGILVYTTCSYSPAENEQIVDWISENYPVAVLPLYMMPAWGIESSFTPVHRHPCYRFYPHKVKGEGFFLSVLQKKDGAVLAAQKGTKMASQEKLPPHVLSPWVNPDAALMHYLYKEKIYLMPPAVYAFYLTWHKVLNIRKAGVCAGQWLRNGLQPDHALAMSQLLHANVPRVELSKEDSLDYLRKAAIAMPAAPTGWLVPAYQGLVLGWAKNLGNRINNYYPKEHKLRH
jgi:16S rRNA C967 or C1407 C5-methylase (RsmB/RsmF family)/NOL1/NOP2/fmu family ribosome biogenesis protein